MKKLGLFAALVLISQSAFSALVITPLPGTNVKQLPQDVISALPQKASDFFSSRIDDAEKKYNDTVASLKSNSKNKNHSADELNRQILQAVQEREKAFEAAKQETVCFAVKECNNLCTVELDGVTSAECSSPNP